MQGIKGKVVVVSGARSESIREWQQNWRGHVKARKKKQRATASHVASERRAGEGYGSSARDA